MREFKQKSFEEVRISFYKKRSSEEFEERYKLLLSMKMPDIAKKIRYMKGFLIEEMK